MTSRNICYLRVLVILDGPTVIQRTCPSYGHFRDSVNPWLLEWIFFKVLVFGPHLPLITELKRLRRKKGCTSLGMETFGVIY